MKLIIVFALALTCLVINNAYAGEDWRCTQEGITREGTVFVSCGTGESGNLAFAKDMAFSSAKHQFTQICYMDSECSHREISVEPGRTTCEEFEGRGIGGLHKPIRHRCFSLIRFAMGKKTKHPKFF
jgi:hypothetical protein